MRRLTKTFIENRWYRKVSAGQFVELPQAETNEGPPIDRQIRDWVDATGHIIIHPGQLGMHTSWHGDTTDHYHLKCLTFGLTVLYQEASHGGRTEPIQHPDPAGIDSGAAPISPGTEIARPWGGD